MTLRRSFVIALGTAALALPALGAQPPYNTLLRDTPAQGHGDLPDPLRRRR